MNTKLANELDTKYYTADIHRACFALPAFACKVSEC
jgi:spermidine synthase